jgi:hypothetical protein
MSFWYIWKTKFECETITLLGTPLVPLEKSRYANVLCFTGLTGTAGVFR